MITAKAGPSRLALFVGVFAGLLAATYWLGQATSPTSLTPWHRASLAVGLIALLCVAYSAAKRHLELDGEEIREFDGMGRNTKRIKLSEVGAVDEFSIRQGLYTLQCLDVVAPGAAIRIARAWDKSRALEHGIRSRMRSPSSAEWVFTQPGLSNRANFWVETAPWLLLLISIGGMWWGSGTTAAFYVVIYFAIFMIPAIVSLRKNSLEAILVDARGIRVKRKGAAERFVPWSDVVGSRSGQILLKDGGSIKYSRMMYGFFQLERIVYEVGTTGHSDFIEGMKALSPTHLGASGNLQGASEEVRG